MNILGVKDLGLSSEILGLRVVYMCVCVSANETFPWAWCGLFFYL